MNTWKNKAAATVAGAVVVFGTTALIAPPASAAISCETSSSGKPASFYDGPSASYAYDSRFAKGPAIPELDTYTPQGIATWYSWDGGNDLLVISAYSDGGDAHLIGVDAKTGKHIGTVAIAPTHAGGVAITQGWAFVAGEGNTIRKYRLSDLETAMKQSGTPYLEQVGDPREVYGASFLTSYGNNLYAGKFSENDREKMYRYTVDTDGSLTTQSGAYEVPVKTQGLMVTDTHFVFSTSYGNDNRGNIYVVDAGARDIDISSTRCYRSPSMNEGITESGGYAYLVFESGAAQYVAKNPRNVIRNLHMGPVSGL
ncbi:hypothetical protein [Amycolatopsis pigmentata]|uniref:Uncharacterized protein n=1 Tax=Amycolatopsis pigmentata TaxID=450801 RepID=A0ABW5FPD2_9PSEU